MRRSSETGAGTIEHSSLEIRLGKVDRIYRPGEHVSGVVVVRAKAGWSHRGVTLRVEGLSDAVSERPETGGGEGMAGLQAPTRPARTKRPVSGRCSCCFR